MEVSTPEQLETTRNTLCKGGGWGCFLTRAAIFYQSKCENIIWPHSAPIRLEQHLFLYLITQYKIQEANSSELWTNILLVQNTALGRKKEEDTKQEGWRGGLDLGHFPQGFSLSVYIYIYIFLRENAFLSGPVENREVS